MIEHSLLLPTLDSLPQQLMIIDGDGTVLAVNRAWHDFREASGLEQVVPEGLSYTQTLLVANGTPALEREVVFEGIRALLAGRVQQFRHTYQRRLADRTAWFELFAVALPAGRQGAVVSQFDITSERETEDELRIQANHDPLTGLPNRRLFELEAEHALALAKRRGSTATLVFLDLDDFKSVNDNWGHDAGDDLLIHVAQRLREQTRTSDLLARWGGDEFVMLLHDIMPAEYRTAVTRYRAALQRPTRANGRPQSTSGSFGAAFFPEHGLALAALLSQADHAMYLDKIARREPDSRAGRRSSPSGSAPSRSAPSSETRALGELASSTAANSDAQRTLV